MSTTSKNWKLSIDNAGKILYVYEIKQDYNHEKYKDNTIYVDKIEIHCENKVIYIQAEADCCSISWFEFISPITTIIKKTPISIDEKRDSPIKLPKSFRQECDENIPIILEFNDKSNYQMILRNSSNGYYSGYIDVKIGVNSFNSM